MATEHTQASAVDVAAYILQETGPIESMKLQKLVYYAQAWSLAWCGSPLFLDRIEAWKHGPVVRTVWAAHERGRGSSPLGCHDLHGGYADRVSQEQRRCISIVLGMYSSMTSPALRAKTHEEDPWIIARGSLREEEPSNEEILREVIRNYYKERSMIELGAAYNRALVSVHDVAYALHLDIFDALSLIEKHGYCRPIESIELSSEERAAQLKRIRENRIRRGGKVTVSESEISSSVIASQRLEGVDARPWVTNANKA